MKATKMLVLLLSQFMSLSSQSRVGIIANPKIKLIQWIDNELKIAVEGENCEDVVAKVSKGIIKKGDKCNFVYNCEYGVSSVWITIGVKRKGAVDWMDSSFIIVEQLRDPIVRFILPQSGDSVGLNEWHMAFHEEPTDTFVFCPNLWCEEIFGGFDIVESSNEKIVKFNLKVIRSDSAIYNEVNVGDVFSKNVCYFLYHKVQKGDTVVFDQIICEMYGKERRKIKQPVLFYISR